MALTRTIEPLKMSRGTHLRIFVLKTGRSLLILVDSFLWLEFAHTTIDILNYI